MLLYTPKSVFIRCNVSNSNPYLAKPGNILLFENSVDPDQLAFQKPAGQDPHCFQICLFIHTKKIELFKLIGHKFGRSVVHENIQHAKG